MHTLNFAVSFEVKHPTTSSWESRFLEQVQLSYKTAFQNFPNYQEYPIFRDFKTKHPQAKQLEKIVEVAVLPLLQNFKSFPGIAVPKHFPSLDTAAFKIEILDADFFQPEQLHVSLTLISEWVELIANLGTQIKFIRMQDKEANSDKPIPIYNAQISEGVTWHELKPNKDDYAS